MDSPVFEGGTDRYDQIILGEECIPDARVEVMDVFSSDEPGRGLEIRMNACPVGGQRQVAGCTA